ncbi:porin family protein [Candidatus Eisenbacteria bacterium]|uniref:Porin family protein n=1 Tax=Eiseniibacteriota bacterium TaxID=2212470 RepID=A0ABV6YIF2_UNCEI
MARWLLVAIVFSCLLAGPALGQFQEVDFSLKGGINYANMAVDPDPGNGGSILRFGGGGTLGMNFSRKFSIGIDVLYLMKGTKNSYRDGGSIVHREVEFHTELDYLVINPNFRLQPTSGRSTPYLTLGPEIGILLKATSHTEDDRSNGEKQDVKDSFESTDIAINFGAGLDFPIGSSNFFIESRYSFGLTDVSATQPDDESGAKLTTRGIYAFAGIRF